MDWKSYYTNELSAPGTRDKIAGWLRAAYEVDGPAGSANRRTVWSFPHTAIDFCGPLQARVVASLYRARVRRAVALGVMHGSWVAPYVTALDESRPPEEREGAFATVSGAFAVETTRLTTPFGHVDIEPTPPAASIRADRENLLKREFSLDTFHAILRLAADVFQSDPPRLLPLYVGMTRHPTSGSFEGATRLAGDLHREWSSDTAIVTTGDVVHYGRVYGPTDRGDSTQELAAYFLERLRVALDLALTRRDLEGAHSISQSELRSDQREILPVLAHLLGTDAKADIVSFEMSDYAPIFDVDPPCRVASSLIAYVESARSEG